MASVLRITLLVGFLCGSLALECYRNSGITDEYTEAECAVGTEFCYRTVKEQDGQETVVDADCDNGKSCTVEGTFISGGKGTMECCSGPLCNGDAAATGNTGNTNPPASVSSPTAAPSTAAAGSTASGGQPPATTSSDAEELALSKTVAALVLVTLAKMFAF